MADKKRIQVHQPSPSSTRDVSPASSLRNSLRGKTRGGSVSSQLSLGDQASFQTARSTPPSDSTSASSGSYAPPTSAQFPLPPRTNGHLPGSSSNGHSSNGSTLRHIPAAVVSDPHASFSRMVGHLPHPATPQLRASMDFEMTPELIAEIDRAHDLGVAGAAGVAYSGGPLSNAVMAHFGAGRSSDNLLRTAVAHDERAREPLADRNLDWDRASDPRRTNGVKVHADAPTQHQYHHQQQQQQASPASVHAAYAHTHAPRGMPRADVLSPGGRSDSPTFHTPMGTPQLHASGYHHQSDQPRDAHFPNNRPPSAGSSTTTQGQTPTSTSMSQRQSNESPPQRGTPPVLARVQRQTPPALGAKTRTPDKSLPVQEEPEDEVVLDPQDLPGSSDVDRNVRGVFSPAPVVPPVIRRQQNLMHAVEVAAVPSERHAPVPASGLSPTTHQSQQARSIPIANGNVNGNGGAPAVQLAHSRSQSEGSTTPNLSPPKPPVVEHPPPAPPASKLPSTSGAHHPHTNGAAAAAPRQKTRNGSSEHMHYRSFDASVLENGHEHVMAPHARPIHPYYAPQFDSARSSWYSAAGHGPSPFDDFVQGQQQQQQQQQPYDPVQAYYRSLMPSVPPTPLGHQSLGPSPSPLLSGMRLDASSNPRPILPPYSPAPLPVGSPYPFPYGHIRRNQAPAVSQPPTVDMSLYDPAVIREQLARQMQMYALNNAAAAQGGALSDSTLSPSSTPFPGPAYNPWTFLQTSRAYGAPPSGPIRADASVASVSRRSSPSHEPLPMPTRPHNLRRAAGAPGGARMNGHSNGNGNGNGVERGHGHEQRKHRPPARVQSTQPRETSPELGSETDDSSGEETAGRAHESGRERERDGEEEYLSSSSTWLAGGDSAAGAGAGREGKEWIDEHEEGEGEDLLELEMHTDYVINPEKRRRRWDARWKELMRDFNALDRETDATMVLFAAPAHGSELRCVASRGLRRAPFSLSSTGMTEMRALFEKLSAQRDVARAAVPPLVQRLGSGVNEGDLRSALDTALGSLAALGHIYEEREVRWAQEMRRLDEDRERVQLLLAQVLGVPFPGAPLNPGL